MVNPTVANSPIDNRSVIFQPGDTSDRIGAQHGQVPGMNQPGIGQDSEPRAQTEIGFSEDTMEVYRGDIDMPLERAPAWRYSAKDALHAPVVSAVEKLHDAFDQSEKALAAQDAQKKKP